jgi:hypothetical protein
MPRFRFSSSRPDCAVGTRALLQTFSLSDSWAASAVFRRAAHHAPATFAREIVLPVGHAARSDSPGDEPRRSV